MKKQNTVVKSLWIDQIIGPLQILCINSFLNKGISFHLYTYGTLLNAPSGTIIKDANDIIDSSEIFKDKMNSYATYSDWFRIALLHKIGGWWVDCDVFCIKPFNINAPYIFATERAVIGGEKRIQICNAVIKMPAKSLFGEKVLVSIKKKLKSNEHELINWTEIGAQLLYKNIDEENLYDYVLQPEVFCPNDYLNYLQLSNLAELSFNKTTYGVHLWNKMWEWSDIDPLESATDDSFFGKAKRLQL
jgi:hypothetical protein